MKYHFAVTVEAPDAWHETANYGDGLKGREWCSDALRRQILNIGLGVAGSSVTVESLEQPASDIERKQ